MPGIGGGEFEKVRPLIPSHGLTVFTDITAAPIAFCFTCMCVRHSAGSGDQGPGRVCPGVETACAGGDMGATTTTVTATTTTTASSVLVVLLRVVQILRVCICVYVCVRVRVVYIYMSRTCVCTSGACVGARGPGGDRPVHHVTGDTGLVTRTARSPHPRLCHREL